MFLTYYNEEEAMEYFKQESFEKGCEQGSELKMISVVRNMYLNRGFDVETISELVEEPAERVDAIVRALQAAPEKSEEAILAVLSGRKA